MYVAESNELVFADTSVIGWLYALDVNTFQVRVDTWSAIFDNLNLML